MCLGGFGSEFFFHCKTLFGRTGFYELIGGFVTKVVRVNRSFMDNGNDGRATVMANKYWFYQKPHQVHTIERVLVLFTIF